MRWNTKSPGEAWEFKNNFSFFTTENVPSCAISRPAQSFISSNEKNNNKTPLGILDQDKLQLLKYKCTKS